jgi:glycosyltransferase involved in cell wall biosynthesis
MPLISIIVPVYKVKEEYLRRCIESLVNQTFGDIEIILVDDGTPDKGGALCDYYEQQDKRIKVIHQENQGVSASRNHGIEVATGEWITFVDADDWVELNACEKLKNIIINEDLDMLIFALKVNFPDKEFENPFWKKSYTHLKKNDREELQLQLLYKTVSQYSPPYNMVGVAVCKLYSSEFLKKFDLKYNTNLTLSEDGVFVFQALENADKVVYINEFLYHYRKHDESATNRYRENAESDYGNALKVLEEYIAKFGKKGIFYTAFYYRAIFNIFALSHQLYCNENNKAPHLEKIRSVRDICKKEPYFSAIRNISFVDFSKNSSYYRKIGFSMLKLRLYSLFYCLCLIKLKINGKFIKIN